MIAEPLRGLVRPIGDLRTLEGNPRRGDVAAVKRSLQRFGQRKPIVVREDGTVTAGNHTLLAARELGWTEIAVVGTEDDDATAKAYALADNRTSALGSFDMADLALMAAEVHAVDPELLEAASFTEADLNALLAGRKVPDKRTDPDAVPDAPAEPVTVPGDVWELGPHRLLCGDSTAAADMERIMDGASADLVWTDPPYGVAYQTKLDDDEYARHRRQDGKVVANDELTPEELRSFLHAALGNALQHSRPGAPWYVAAPGGPRHLDFLTVLNDLGVWREIIIWVKDQFVFGRQDYHWRHEPILYGWKEGAAHTWDGGRSQDTVWVIPRPRRSEEHPTMKPVELITRALANSSAAGALVLDPFGGSGSTLIAAHGLNRVARLVELDPAYADVICRRYQEHTGTKPVLQATGEPHDFTAAG